MRSGTVLFDSTREPGESTTMRTPTTVRQVDGEYSLAANETAIVLGRASPGETAPELQQIIVDSEVQRWAWLGDDDGVVIVLSRYGSDLGNVRGSLPIGPYVAEATLIVKVDASGKLAWAHGLDASTQYARVKILPSGATAVTLFTIAIPVRDETGEHVLEEGYNTFVFDRDGTLTFVRPGRTLGETSSGEVVLFDAFEGGRTLEEGTPEQMRLGDDGGPAWKLYAGRYDAGGRLLFAKVLVSTAQTPFPELEYVAAPLLLDDGFTLLDGYAEGTVFADAEAPLASAANVLARYEGDLTLAWMKPIETVAPYQVLVTCDGPDTWILAGERGQKDATGELCLHQIDLAGSELRREVVARIEEPSDDRRLPTAQSLTVQDHEVWVTLANHWTLWGDSGTPAEFVPDDPLRSTADGSRAVVVKLRP